MSLKSILIDAFSGGRGTPRGTIGSLLDELKQLAKGRRGAGRASGVSESTLRGWDAGIQPRDPVGAALKLANAIRSFWRTDPTGGTIRVTIANPGRGPANRTVAVDPKAMERAGDAYQRGDYNGMVREFRRGITDEWYRENLLRPQPGDPGGEDEDDDPGEDSDPAEDSQEGWDMERSDPVAGGVSW